MVDNKIQDEMISAYLDGELTAGERAQVAQWIENDPRARNVYQELQQLRESLQNLPSEKFDKNLKQDILSQIKTTGKDSETTSGTLVAAAMMPPPPETEYAVAASAACHMDAPPAAMSYKTDKTSADERVSVRGDRRRIYLWPAVAVAAAILLMIFSSRRETKTERTVAQNRMDSLEMKNIQSELAAPIAMESRPAPPTDTDDAEFEAAPPATSEAFDDFTSKPTPTAGNSLPEESSAASQRARVIRPPNLSARSKQAGVSSVFSKTQDDDVELVSKAERVLSLVDQNPGDPISPIYFAFVIDGKMDLRQQLRQITQGEETELLELAEIEEREDLELEEPSDEEALEFSEAEVEQPYSQRLTTLRVFELRGPAAMHFPQVIAKLKGISSYAGPLEVVEPNAEGAVAEFDFSDPVQKSADPQSAKATTRPVRLIFIDTSRIPAFEE